MVTESKLIIIDKVFRASRYDIAGLKSKRIRYGFQVNNALFDVAPPLPCSTSEELDEASSTW